MPGSLYLIGKLGGPGRLNAVAAGQLIHMPDQTSNRRFLVVIWLVQPYKPMAETSSSAHTTGAANAGVASARAASTRAASAGAASQCRTSKQAEPEPGGGVRFRTAGL
jgi:hypothetical protein